MTDYLRLPIGDEAPNLINVVIEIPLGSINKYEYDKSLHVFRLDRALYSPVHYPGDYGFIPATLASDGDPLDVLIFVDGPSFPGCLMKARPVGLLEMLDQGVPDEKVIAVPDNAPRFAEVHEYSELFEHTLREVEHFFSIYKDLEGKRTKITGWKGTAYAQQVITDSHTRYQAGIGDPISEKA